MVHIILCRIKKEVGIINATFNMIFKYKGQLLTGTVKGDEAFIFLVTSLTDTRKGSSKYIRKTVLLLTKI